MEGLPGVDELKKYEFVMRRRGGWQAEIDRLKAEAARQEKKAERVSSGFVRTKHSAYARSLCAALLWVLHAGRGVVGHMTSILTINTADPRLWEH